MAASAKPTDRLNLETVGTYYSPEPEAGDQHIGIRTRRRSTTEPASSEAQKSATTSPQNISSVTNPERSNSSQRLRSSASNHKRKADQESTQPSFSSATSPIDRLIKNPIHRMVIDAPPSSQGPSQESLQPITPLKREDPVHLAPNPSAKSPSSTASQPSKRRRSRGSADSTEQERSIVSLPSTAKPETPATASIVPPTDVQQSQRLNAEQLSPFSRPPSPHDTPDGSTGQSSSLQLNELTPPDNDKSNKGTAEEPLAHAGAKRKSSRTPSDEAIPTPSKPPTRTSARAKKPVLPPAEPVHEHNTRRKGKTATPPAPSAQSHTSTSRKGVSHKRGAGKSANGKGGSHRVVETEETKRRASESDELTVQNLLGYDATPKEGDDELLLEKKLLIAKAKNDLLEIGQDKPKLKARCGKLAMDVINLEEQAVINGTHSCFEDLTRKHEERLRINEASKRLKMEWFQTECEAKIQQAENDFILRRADERQSLLQEYQDLIWRLKDEKRMSDDAEIWGDEITVDVKVRRKQAEIEELRRSASGVPPYADDFPEYVKDKLQDNRRRGGRVIVPPTLCRGLRKSEIDMDMDIIRAAASASEQ
ncbi:hypothetical protein DFJ77DRAFT_437142 [Powellomyces hirtus]|nr:hypothetical protein DFJ77DRAFT_437142 [Powellomyces hirtus]